MFILRQKKDLKKLTRTWRYNPPLPLDSHNQKVKRSNYPLFQEPTAKARSKVSCSQPLQLQPPLQLAMNSGRIIASIRRIEFL